MHYLVPSVIFIGTLLTLNPIPTANHVNPSSPHTKKNLPTGLPQSFWRRGEGITLEMGFLHRNDG